MEDILSRISVQRVLRVLRAGSRQFLPGGGVLRRAPECVTAISPEYAALAGLIHRDSSQYVTKKIYPSRAVGNCAGWSFVRSEFSDFFARLTQVPAREARGFWHGLAWSVPSVLMRLKQRDIRIDGLRGMLLVIMAGVHVPTPLSHKMQEPFGFTSAAEGFMFLGAVLAGRVYGAVYGESGFAEMARRVWNRAKLVYSVHVMVASAAVLIAWVFARDLPPLANHFHDFIAHPWRDLALLPFLLHQPPLFDILPLYVIFLGFTPWLVAYASRHGWQMVLAVSALIWALGQWETRAVGDASDLLHLRLGSFNVLAWQFLWVAGLALGEAGLRGPVIAPQHRGKAAALALPVVVAGLLCRHGWWPDGWFPPQLYLWMDKWTLGPLRLLNFGAWAVLLLAWNPSAPEWLLKPLMLLGRNSLAVFAFHLPLAIGAATAIQILSPSASAQTVIGVFVIAALFPWAAWCEFNRRREARVVPEATPAPAPLAEVMAEPGQALA